MKELFSKVGSAMKEKLSGITQRIAEGTAGKSVSYYKHRKKMLLVSIAVLLAVLVPVVGIAANGNMNRIVQPEVTEPVVQQVQPEVPEEQPEAQVQPGESSPLPEAADPGVLLEETMTGGAQAADLQFSGVVESAPTEAPAVEEKVYMDLVPGTNHADVIELQKRLTELNYMENDEPTDYYGDVTKQAVGYFQRKHGLQMDGIAGVKTQELLFSEGAKPYTVTLGADGADVESMQQRLADLGYPVSVTGYFGTETESAVKYFQRMNGLTDDGSVGAYTKEVLYSSEAIPSETYLEDQEKQPDETTEESGGSKDNGDGGSASAPKPESTPKPEPTPQPEPAPAAAADPGNVEAFVSAALAQEGKKYVLGGKGPDTFDCSGLVYYALNQSGNSIGYMTSGGWAKSGYATIGYNDLQRGDVICVSGHVAIYLGDGMMVDGSSSNGKVVVRQIGSWIKNNFICGKRPL